jgi:branched-chain amino acid transport system ATP-binding protein
MLACNDLTVAYGDIVALQGVTLEVRRGETIALIGANGAGKTTLLQAISGLNPVRSGDILFDGASIARAASDRRVSLGIAQAPEGRRIFPGLTVEENLSLATVNWRRWRQPIADDLARVFDLFPRLKERRHQMAGTMSGGEQQMCAIGRAMMSNPKLLLLDEPSAGLAPVVVQQVFELVRRIRASGLTVLIVEQNVQQVLKVVDRAYLIEAGTMRASGTSAEMLASDTVKEAYLGV